MIQLELIEHTDNKERIDILSSQLKELIHSRDLNKRLISGSIIKEIKDKKLFKDRYKYFKTYCDKILNIKSSRADYIYRFYLSFKDIEKYLNPMPITIEQVKIFMGLDKDTSIKLWNLALMRFENNLSFITETELRNLLYWIIGNEPLRLFKADNKDFLKAIIRTLSEKNINLVNEVQELNKESLELELENNKLKNNYGNISRLKDEINTLKVELSYYKTLYSFKTNNISSVKDDYKALGLSSGCSKSDIKKAFRTLSFEYHPDKIENLNLTPIQKTLFNDKFKEIKQAYDNLIGAI